MDRATTDHPVLVKRGGHNDVCNSQALRLAGITSSTPDPQGGIIVRDAAGQPTGRLIDSAIALAERLRPASSSDEQVEALGTASRDYAARGIGTVRDAAVSQEEMPLLRDAIKRGMLAVRARVLILMAFAGAKQSITEFLGGLAEDGIRPGSGDDWLRVWGLKIVLDGGIENAALDQPYANRPDFTGQLMWDPGELEQTVHQAASRGWRIGVHACGDRAVRTVLDVYERVLQGMPGLPPGTLVIEHAGLAHRDQRARAVRLGVSVTVQHPLLAALAPALIEYWGERRVRDMFPLREWLDEGGIVAAGSDYPNGGYAAMASLAGMVTRSTRAGVLGPRHAISREEAAYLHTAGAARFLDEQHLRGTLAPGLFADLAAYTADPFTAPIGTVAGLLPELTIVGGRPVHDTHQLLRPDQDDWLNHAH